MAPVIRNLASVPDDDIRALATYIADGMGERQPAPPAGAVAGGQWRRDHLCRGLRQLP